MAKKLRRRQRKNFWEELDKLNAWELNEEQVNKLLEDEVFKPIQIAYEQKVNVLGEKNVDKVLLVKTIIQEFKTIKEIGILGF